MSHAVPFVRASIVLVALFCAAPSLVIAQENYPNRPVRVIVPLSAGGSADVIPRMVAEKLTQRFGQTFVIENRPGATGGVGAEVVFKAEPDGYTLLATTPPVLVINESLYRKIAYDPRAFVPVSIVSALSNVLAVSNKAPFTTLDGLIAFAKANPDKLNYASPGLGSSQHLAMEWLKSLAGIKLTHVPYGGTGPALNDVIAGHVDVMFAGAVSVLPLMAGNRLRGIAVDSEKRIVGIARRADGGGDIPGLRGDELERVGRAAEDRCRHRRETVGGDRRGGAAARRQQAAARHDGDPGRQYAGGGRQADRGRARALAQDHRLGRHQAAVTAYAASLAFSRGAAKSMKARSFSGSNPWPACTRLTGHGAGSNFSSASVSAPARSALATW